MECSKCRENVIPECREEKQSTFKGDEMRGGGGREAKYAKKKRMMKEKGKEGLIRDGEKSWGGGGRLSVQSYK